MPHSHPRRPSRHGPRWALWSLLTLVILLCLLLIPPARSLLSITHDNAGWSLHNRPLTDIVSHGFFHVGAHFETPKFTISNLAADSDYCPTEVSHGYGPLSFHRHYNWERPGDTPATRKQRMQACRALRSRLLQIPGTLSAALISGDRQKVQAHLGDAIVKKGTLAVTLPEVGEPMRQKLAELMLAPANQPQAISLVDVALVLGDTESVQRWLPRDGFNSYQRYALFRLGQTSLVEEHASSSSTYRGWRTADPHSQADGFQRSDYYLANAHCDSRYAAFLAGKGITADGQVILQAFLSRLVHETPDALRQASLDYPVLQLPAYSAEATPRDCSALMEQYKDVALSAQQLDTLSRMTGAQMLTDYQAMLARAEQGHTFKTREEQWQFDDRQPFNQQSAPLPSLPGMFTALLKSRPDATSVCAALDVLPWMLGHDQALAKFMALASSWQGQPVATDALEDAYRCSPALLMPPSLFERETRERDAFLKQAGLACHLLTPKQQYVYAQRVECDHEH